MHPAKPLRRGFNNVGIISGYYPPIMENQMEKNMENEMETVVILGVRFLELQGQRSSGIGD